MDSVTRDPRPLEAGIDWVTCSAERPSLADALLRLGKDLVEQEVGCGGVEAPYHRYGFAGRCAGAAAYGFSGTRTLVTVSGATARESAAELLQCAENVSRLDVQATVRADGCGADYAKELYSSLGGVPRRRGREISRTLITSNYTGDTLNIGRRISDSYGRIYNKSAEEKVKENPLRWRFEVEFKRRQALAAARSYASSRDKGAWCIAQVRDWFTRRHCDTPISATDCVDSLGTARGSSTQANRIRWLRVGVAPVVRQLALDYGWPDVLSLLGVPMRYSERYVNEEDMEGN